MVYEEFIQLRELYIYENRTYKKSMICHVGVDGGFYSEIIKMFECMIYCHMNKIKFVLYADDANFSSGHGWETFFEPFCELNHNRLNHYFNTRFKRNHKLIRFIQYPFKVLLKKQTQIDFLTDELFDKYALNYAFKNEFVKWPLLNMNGPVHSEFIKLVPLALRYNEETRNAVNECIKSLDLPEKYISVQIRGGDKVIEVENLFTCEDVIMNLELRNLTKNVFIFTDVYQYVIELKNSLPDWQIYTLAIPEDKGYVNNSFNSIKWAEKKCSLIKLFAMVEICIQSEFHYGDYRANPNLIIKGIKPKDKYADLKSKKELELDG